MLIGSKNLEIYSNVVPTVHNFVLVPPNEPILGNDNTSPICFPNGVWAAQAAFAPRVANAKFFVSSDENSLNKQLYNIIVLNKKTSDSLSPFTYFNTCGIGHLLGMVCW